MSVRNIKVLPLHKFVPLNITKYESLVIRNEHVLYIFQSLFKPNCLHNRNKELSQVLVYNNYLKRKLHIKSVNLRNVRILGLHRDHI